MTRTAYRPEPSDFQRLILAINAGTEDDLESAIGRIAKGALAARRKSTKRRSAAESKKVSK